LPDESLLDRMPKPRSFPHAGRADALAPEHVPSLAEETFGPERNPDAKDPAVGLERPFVTDDAHDVERILLLPLRRRRGGAPCSHCARWPGADWAYSPGLGSVSLRQPRIC